MINYNKKILYLFTALIFTLILGVNFVLAGDNDSNTKLLLHFDGPDNSTNDIDFVDSASTTDAVTQEGGAVLKEVQYKFGGTSVYFDGGGDYISVTDSNNHFDFGSDDFTIDWWEYRTNSEAQRGSVVRDGSVGYQPFLFGWSNGTSLLAYMSSNNTSWDIVSASSMGSISLNQWVHFAVTRNGNNFYAFKNGVQTSTWTSSAALLASANPFTLGIYASSYYYQGYLDEVRVTKGVARWTSNFTPPTNGYYEIQYPGTDWILCTVSGVAGTGTSYPIPTVDWSFTSSQSDYNDGSAPPGVATPTISAATQESYYVEIDDNSNFSSPEFTTSASSTDTQYTVASSGLSFNTYYNWRVKTYDNLGSYNYWLDDNNHSFRSEIEIPTCSAVNDSTSQITITASSLTNLAVGTSGTYHDCTGASCDTGINVWVANGLSDSATGLSTDTQYIFQVRARNASSTATAYGATCQTYTSANTPGVPVLSSPTATTINVNPTSGGSETTMAIYVEQGTTCDGSGGLGYVQSNGSISASEVWQSDASWGTKTVTGLTAETGYSFCVKSRNGDADETSFGADADESTTAVFSVAKSIKLNGEIFLQGGIKFK